MPVQATALPPKQFITQIPGRFAPIRIVDKRSPALITTSTATSNLNPLLFRTETADSSLATPTTPVTELGTNFNVGEYDDIAESKATITSWDVGVNNMSLITGKAVNQTSGQTTTYGYNELSTAVVDIVRQFADPTGNVFASLYMGDMVIDQYKVMLKQKSAAMEEYSLQGFNMLFFKGQIQTKAYVVLAADVTAGFFSVTPILGTSEIPVPLPVPSGSQPASYWIQRGSLNFLKIDRWRPATSFIRIRETTGTVSTGVCKYVLGTGQLSFATGDLVVGDVFLLTYATYASNVPNYTTIEAVSADTSDPVAVSTRLTPIVISANALSRGAAFDMTMTLKRARADGVGDIDGFYGVPDAPEVAVSLEVDMTDFSLFSVLSTGSPFGTDSSGSVTGDFHDPNYATRTQLTSPMAVGCKLLDPRNSANVLKNYLAANVFFSSENINASSKSSVTAKFTGKDQVGNLVVSFTHP